MTTPLTSAVPSQRFAIRRPGAMTVLLIAVAVALAVQAVARRWFWPQVIPAELDGSTLVEVIGGREGRRAVVDSVVVAALSAPVAVAASLAPAWLVATGRGLARRALATAMALPALLPPVATGIGLTVWFIDLRLHGTLAAVVLAHAVAASPYVFAVLVGVFARLDRGYETMASGLGWGPISTGVRVVARLAAPGFATALAIGFIASWGQYLLTVLVGGGRIITLPMLVLSAGLGSNPSRFAALALVATAVPVLALLVAPSVASLRRARST